MLMNIFLLLYSCMIDFFTILRCNLINVIVMDKLESLKSEKFVSKELDKSELGKIFGGEKEVSCTPNGNYIDDVEQEPE